MIIIIYINIEVGRKIRHIKIKQKISGHFKSMDGLQGYLDIRSVIIIYKKLGIDFYNCIKNIYINPPVII